ncbi:MAG: DUF7521 family protein [Halanaeroarchaeum sp.]
MEFSGAVILGTTLTVLVAGGLVTSVALRAARRTSARTLWTLAIGMALITLGTVLTEVVLFLGREQVHAIDVVICLVLATGFTVLAYSVYGGYT